MTTQWRHKRRSTIYTEIGRAELQAQSKSKLFGGATMVVYCDSNGKLWCRAEAEFEDGRFEPLHNETPPDAIAQTVIDAAILPYRDLINTSPILLSLLNEADLPPELITSTVDANRLIVICELFKLVPPEVLEEKVNTYNMETSDGSR